MAKRTWKGGNSAVAQVWKGTVTTTTGGHTYIVTLTDSNGDTSVFTYTLTGSEGSTTAVAAAFVVAWNLSTDPRISQITATSSSGQIILTADSGGVPFTASTSGTGTWSGTGNTTANAGPYDWNDPANWVEGAVPTGSDDVVIQGTTPIKYGLNQSGTSLGAVNFQNTSGAHGNPGLPLRLSCTSFNFSCTGISYINLGSSTVAPRITQTASAAAEAYGLYLLGSGITTLRVEGAAAVGLAINKGETSTAATIQCTGAGRVGIGEGVTLTTLRQSSGTVYLNCGATTVLADRGNLYTAGSGAITTFTNNGATVTSNSTGTITTCNQYAGTADFLQSSVARTVTTFNLYGGTLKMDPAVLTLTNKIDPKLRLSISAAQE